MSVMHNGSKIPSAGSILSANGQEWVTFVWDEYLTPGSSISDYRFFTSPGLEVVGSEVVSEFKYRGGVYTTALAVLVGVVSTEESPGAVVPYTKEYISNKVTLSDGTEVTRTVSVLTGSI